jgi:hypothetical protein
VGVGWAAAAQVVFREGQGKEGGFALIDAPLGSWVWALWE